MKMNSMVWYRFGARNGWIFVRTVGALVRCELEKGGWSV